MLQEKFLANPPPPPPTPDSSAASKDNRLDFKLPYFGPFSITTQLKVKKSVSTFSVTLPCLKSKLVLGTKILSLRVYDCAPFTIFHCRLASMNISDKHFHIFKHLRSYANCCFLYSEERFKIFDFASTSFQLNTPLHIVFSTLFSLFENVVKHNLPSLIYC